MGVMPFPGAFMKDAWGIPWNMSALSVYDELLSSIDSLRLEIKSRDEKIYELLERLS